MVNIKTLKSRISAKYPSEPITAILKDAPDQVAPEELIGMLQTWQSVIDAGKKPKNGEV